MKLFAIIQTMQQEIHIKRTDNGSSFSRQCVIAEADTYPEAVNIRDINRKRVDEAKSISTDRWHDKWRKAEENGDMETLLRLGHANR